MKKIFLLVLLLCILVFGMSCNKSKKVSTALEEELKASSLVTMGTIPDWLSGTLIRNGPITVTIDGKTNAHWFDGLAMLHAFSFDRGKVVYTNKFLRTDAYEEVFKKGSLKYDGFAEDPCRSHFKRFFTWFFPSHSELHNANINVAKIANQYVALTEIPLPIRFDPQTLETLGVLDYEDKLPHEKCWESAHPHYDHSTKQTLNYLIQYGYESTYTLYSLNDDSSKRTILAEIPVKEPAYMHSFAMTENYVIFTEFPFVVKPLDLLLKGQAFVKNFAWKPERGTHFIVVNRKTGQVVKRFETKPFFAFHHANAFEVDDKIFLDIVTYEDAAILMGIAAHFKEGSKEENFQSRLERFVLSLKTDTLSSETILNGPIEFPRLNEKWDGKSYQYLYVIDARDSSSPRDVRPLYKVNTKTKELLKWSEEGCYPGEPVFVSTPNAIDEDDGVILAIVLDLLHHNSFLLILDGKTFQEIGRAIVTHEIPAGLHGQYFK